jgi:hypothetical protein
MTMRAYMSRTNHGQADCAMRPDCAGHPMDAMAEARAILAQSEPVMVVQTTAGPMLAGAGFLPPCTDSWLKGSEWGAALAESLAQFIAA